MIHARLEGLPEKGGEEDPKKRWFGSAPNTSSVVSRRMQMAGLDAVLS